LILNHKSSFGQKVRQWLLKSKGLLVSTGEACLICGKTARVAALCDACLSGIPWIKEIHCTTCGRYEECYDCSRRMNTYFVSNRSAVQYDEVMKSVLAMYKYRGDERLLPLFVNMLSKAYERMLLDLQAVDLNHRIDFITYAPLSEQRQLERGFNQAEQMAQGISHRYKIPVIPLLSRRLHTQKQSLKARSNRLSDLQHAFEVNFVGLDVLRQTGGPKPCIVLIDDIYTTGSTLNECARTIRNAIPDARIYGLSWAR